jgi:hypothetical protein
MAGGDNWRTAMNKFLKLLTATTDRCRHCGIKLVDHKALELCHRCTLHAHIENAVESYGAGSLVHRKAVAELVAYRAQ